MVPALMPSFEPPSHSRSENMRAIRDKGNRSTERRLRAHLVRRAIKGWKIRPYNIIGSPDFLFPQLRLVVFVDGCFWHGCPNCGHLPKRNRRYWRAKLSRNMKRDKDVMRSLRACGYKVMRFWECRLKRDPQRCISDLIRRLNHLN